MKGEVQSVPGIFGLRFSELEEVLASEGVNRVHTKVLWRAIYRELKEDWENLDGFSPPLARWLERNGGFWDSGVRVTAEEESGDSLARKFLVRFPDEAEVETVLMAYPGRNTACVSTQVGCAMGCVFCATGQMGFSRHLEAGEIVLQVLLGQRFLRGLNGGALRNLVMMGMGEPLHNYEAVMRALDIVSDKGGLNIGPSRITVSTVGLVPGIVRMADERCPYRLAVSLHGSDEEERSALLPLNKRWPLGSLMEACRYYTAKLPYRIVFGWTLIEGKNDSPAHAARVVELLQGIRSHVNLIRLNPTRGYEGKSPSEGAADVFRDVIRDSGIPCTIRQFRGIDVSAGCGQLKTERVRVR